MKLIPVKVATIGIGEPLPFAVRDVDGTLLANKGYVIPTKKELADFVEKGRGLYVDENDPYYRGYVKKLYVMVDGDAAIGRIAHTQLSRREITPEDDEEAGYTGPPDWLDLLARANTMLRDHGSSQFIERLNKLASIIQRHTRHNPDGVLFAMFHLAASEVRFYSATHSIQVCAMCSVAAREVLNWSPEMEQILVRAALTMNIGMTDLQDRLAVQSAPPTPDQRKQIEHHAARSVQILKEMGVTDAVWLDAVLDHHDSSPGALASRPLAHRIARLIQRADMFSARLAPRGSRTPITPAAAMQATYFDEKKQVDEAGAALIKAVGIYSPGSFVRLATNELAVVVRRGINTTTPRVAVLINREGMPMTDPIVRDTGLRDYRVVASVPHREVRLKISLERLLPLTSRTETAW